MEQNKSIGIVEYRSVALGMKAADDMLKTSNIELIFARTVCPGKYIVLISGNLSAVTSAVEKGKKDEYSHILVDDCILGNPHKSIFLGLYGSTKIEKIEAVGILETYSVCSIIQCADEIVKTTPVKIAEIRIANGMSGKSFVVFTGELSSVKASLDKASKLAEEKGLLLSSAVIPRPDPRLWEEII